MDKDQSFRSKRLIMIQGAGDLGTVVGAKQDPKASALDAPVFRIAGQGSVDGGLSPSIQRG